MIEITTSNSTNVNESLFAFGNLRDEVMFITMTTPTLSPFHQKILTHAKFAKVPTDIYLTKNNPLRAKARPGNAGREPNPTPHPATAGSANTSKVYHIPAFTSFHNPKFKIQNPRISASRERGILTPSALNSAPRLRPDRRRGFTLIELLAVITIIGILAGLTLGAAGAVRRHGATSTAKAEVAALQAACDRYYADNNLYPSNTSINPSTSFAPTAYTTTGQTLFTNLLGSTALTNAPTSKRYFEPKPAMVYTNGAPNYFIDPWGYAYGFNSDGTYAPLIWSTAGQTKSSETNKWITSWPKM
jgi:prepilin-type N-terminal cleavage/methylation domain-containing protein